MGKIETNRRINQYIELAKTRLIVIASLCIFILSVIGLRAIELTFTQSHSEPALKAAPYQSNYLYDRANIVDRNGHILATNLKTSSLYADPKKILNPIETMEKLKTIFIDLDEKKLLSRLTSQRRFVWIKRNITPQQHVDTLKLGLPGVYFQKEEQRVYPYGHLTSHLIGFTDIDNQGISGVEKSFDDQLRHKKDSLTLSLDIRAQYHVHKVLQEAITEFSAIGGTAIVLDANTSEVISLVSQPDFDPNFLTASTHRSRFNQATAGVYEMGSIMKIVNTALTLESGALDLNDGYDTSIPISSGGFTINDLKPKNKWLSIADIFIHSSNRGSAYMALQVGTDKQKSFFKKLGLLDKPQIKLPEVGSPLYPKKWREIHTITMSYGHGIAFTPIQMANIVAAITNGGIKNPIRLTKQPPKNIDNGITQRVISPETSDTIRKLMHLVVHQGTGSKAKVYGYNVGGKTGSAEKPKEGGYSKKANLSSFVATFPVEKPKFVVLVMLDEPKGTKETFGYSTGGWVAAPAVSKIIAKLGPLFHIKPSPKEF